MVLRRLPLVLSLLVGIVGAWTLRDAVGDYIDVLRAYTNVTASYQHGSFAWQGPDYSAASAQLLVTNDTKHAATVERIDVALRFDGAFAGSDYAPFAPLALAPGEARVVTLPLTIIAADRATSGPTADLSLDGTAIFRFDGIERSRAVDFGADIGRQPGAAP